MNKKIEDICAAMKTYNHSDMAQEIFGLSQKKHYDALVVAPGWKPLQIMQTCQAQVVTTGVHSYTSGYEVELHGKQIGWIQTGSGACNLIDHMLICSELQADKFIFVGAVGGLKEEVQIGSIYTPTYCIEGSMASAYLMDNIFDFQPFQTIFPEDMVFIDKLIQMAKNQGIMIHKGSVFCTDSISCEYAQLDFIKAYETDLIEMETSAFYRLASMMKKEAIALLVVSDNTAIGEGLIGKTPSQQNKYDESRFCQIPKLIEMIAGIDCGKERL